MDHTGKVPAAARRRSARNQRTWPHVSLILTRQRSSQIGWVLQLNLLEIQDAAMSLSPFNDKITNFDDKSHSSYT